MINAVLPSEFWQGVELFNRQEYYACHDTLEALWMEASEPQKRFYQGILQIAVACYHLGNHNWRGAVVLLGEGMKRLNYYQPTYEGVDVGDLLTQSEDMLIALQEAGADNIANFVEQLNRTDEANLDGRTQLPKIKVVDAVETSVDDRSSKDP